MKKLTKKEIGTLLKTDPWWIEISEEIDRLHMIRITSVPDQDKSTTIESLFEFTYITDAQLNHAKTDTIFGEALAILTSLPVPRP